MSQIKQQNNRNMPTPNITYQQQSNSQINNQGYSNKTTQGFYQTPGQSSEIRNMRGAGDSKIQMKSDLDYYNSNYPYAQQQQQGQYSQWNDNNYQNKQYGNNQTYDNQGYNQSQKINNYTTPSYEDNYYQNDTQKSQLGVSKHSHNIYEDNVQNSNQYNKFPQKYPTASMQTQFGNNQNTPTPDQQSSKIQKSGINRYEDSNNYSKLQGNSTPYSNNKGSPQTKIDAYDPNQEDLQASQVPESLPVKKQGTILNLDSSIKLPLTNQSSLNQYKENGNNNNNGKLYQNIDMNKQGSSQSTSMYPLQSNQKDSYREQSGYFYQPSLQRLNQESQMERGSEVYMNQNLITKNQEDFEDDVNMQNSTPHIYNNAIPQSNNYHPSKKKQQSNINESPTKNLKGSYYLQVEGEESKVGDQEQSKHAILNFDESQQDMDENGNLRILEYQRGSSQNRLYGQYNDISPNNQQRNAEFYRSDQGRKESLFKYDPTMFQSVTGYFYPSVNTQQNIATRFNAEEVKENLSKCYIGQPEKYKKFESMVQQYLIDQERVYIQMINREISGLQSAENLGDYFVRKYCANQEKRVAGCSRAQVFPVYIGVRGDGNCFYRALMVSYLVTLLTKEENMEKYEQFLCDIASNKHALIELEYKGVMRNDTENVKIILMQQLLLLLLDRKQASTKEEISLFLMKMFDSIANDHDFDYSLVCLCRSMIKYALDQYGTHQIYQEYFLQEDIELTRQKLSTYKEDAEYHAINLSTEIFRHPIQILQLQKDRLGHFEFNESVIYSPYVNEPAQGSIYILLSDGHYDLVFDREMCFDYFPSLGLFKNHWKYREDLEQLIENPSIPLNLKERYKAQMSEYEKFLKEQDHQVVKVRESFANLQTLYQSKIGRIQSTSSINHNENADNNRYSNAKSTIQNSNLILFETVVTQKQSQIKGSDQGLLQHNFNRGEGNLETSQDKLHLQGDISTPIQHAYGDQSKRTGYDNLMMVTPYKETTDGSASKVGLLENSSYRNDKMRENNDEEDEESNSPPFKNDQFNFKESFYNVESDKLCKLNNLSLTPNPSISLESQKKIIVKNYQVNKDNLISCDHASYNNVTIKNIICCKIQYEMCYCCFKTRQILQCYNCKKDILGRITQTCKNYIYYCKKCNSKQTPVCLFNKIYCQECDVQQSHN